MRVAILPSGALLADTPLGDDETTDGLSGAARVRVARAFARGSGHALLALGATELEAPLTPPLAFLRAVLYGGSWRRPTRFGFVAAIAALYAGAFALLYPVYGPSLAALATAPVLAPRAVPAEHGRDQCGPLGG